MAIVVGYVPTKEGRAALASAVVEAARRHVNLVVVNSQRGDKHVDDQETSAYEHEMEAATKQVKAAGLEVEIRQLVRGIDPAEDLMAVAEEIKADLIVIGLRRRTPVGKLILGSNAQRILLDAPCPVLAVKASDI